MKCVCRNTRPSGRGPPRLHRRSVRSGETFGWLAAATCLSAGGGGAKPFGEARLGEASGGADSCLRAPACCQQCADALRDRLGCRSLEEDAGSSFFDRVEEASETECGWRLAEPSGLERSQAEVFVGCGHERAAVGVEPPEFAGGYPADKGHASAGNGAKDALLRPPWQRPAALAAARRRRRRPHQRSCTAAAAKRRARTRLNSGDGLAWAVGCDRRRRGHDLGVETVEQRDPLRDDRRVGEVTVGGCRRPPVPPLQT